MLACFGLDAPQCRMLPAAAWNSHQHLLEWGHMSNTPHTLAEEFPDQLDAIHELKARDPKFAQLLASYDEVNDEIHLAETNVKPVDQMREVELRKRRLLIKDTIAAAIAQP